MKERMKFHILQYMTTAVINDKKRLQTSYSSMITMSLTFILSRRPNHTTRLTFRYDEYLVVYIIPDGGILPQRHLLRPAGTFDMILVCSRSVAHWEKFLLHSLPVSSPLHSPLSLQCT